VRIISSAWILKHIQSNPCIGQSSSAKTISPRDELSGFQQATHKKVHIDCTARTQKAPLIGNKANNPDRSVNAGDS
jgi:hypothetical protein